jgi:hypothetical protein
MVALVVLLLFIILLYRLFVSGWLFKLIILAGFLIGGRIALPMFFPQSLATCITIGGMTISWAMTIILVIIILAMATTRSTET